MRTAAFGQENALANLIIFGLLAAGLLGCGIGANRRYTGHVTVTEGACGLGFDSNSQATATLAVRGDEVQFAPTDGVIVLPGSITAAGHVLARSNAVGADKKPFPQVFEGDRDGDRVRGTFATPRCRAAVDLRRD